MKWLIKCLCLASAVLASGCSSIQRQPVRQAASAQEIDRTESFASAPPRLQTNTYYADWKTFPGDDHFTFSWGTNSEIYIWFTNLTATHFTWTQVLPRGAMPYCRVTTLDAVGRVLYCSAEEIPNGWPPNSIQVTWSPAVPADLQCSWKLDGDWLTIAERVTASILPFDPSFPPAFFRVRGAAVIISAQLIRTWNPTTRHFGR